MLARNALCCQKLLARKVISGSGTCGAYDWIHDTRTRTVCSQRFGAKKWTDHVNLAVISDPADPKFDLEAYLKVSEAT